jgi:hypothetical protein
MVAPHLFQERGHNEARLVRHHGQSEGDCMTLRILLLSAAAAALMAAPALAAEQQPFDDMFFVRRGADAQAMFFDRDQCRKEALALGMGSSAAAYSNPQYGALAAMGAALDSDQLHNGGLRKRMQLAVMNTCMKRMGWEPHELTPGDRAVAHASLKHPEALNAWLKANEPAAPAAPPQVQSQASNKP